jgi:hypothetical protein
MTLALLFAFAAAATNPEELFREFEAAHSKTYSPAERAHRLAIFTENLPKMAEMALADKGSAEYGHLSPFADWSVEEFNPATRSSASRRSSMSRPSRRWTPATSRRPSTGGRRARSRR